MTNHPNRSEDMQKGKALAEQIMAALAGRAGIRIGGDIVQWDSLKKKGKLHVGKASIPVDRLHENLTEHELAELQNLPFWNGSNAYEISATCLRLVHMAIQRFRGSDYGVDMSGPAQGDGEREYRRRELAQFKTQEQLT